MITEIGTLIINLIRHLGYTGIIITMAIESALIPLPSEIIMPFSGFLASTGQFNIHVVALAGAVGNLIGSLILYGLGYWGHDRVVRRFIRNYGKWILVSEEELDKATAMLNRYKDMVVIGSRVLPGVRSVISLPCGIARIPLVRFAALTFVGSLIWSYFLAWIGYILGRNWDVLGPYFHKLDAVIIGAIVILIALYIWHRLKKR